MSYVLLDEKHVSVSSLGSLLLQRRLWLTRRDTLSYCLSILERIDSPTTISGVPMGITVYTFSILERIDSPATLKEGLRVLIRGNFQYPRTDRFPCNVHSALGLSSLSSSFQYPRTDRFPCNFQQAMDKAMNFDFQYPRTDRFPCNLDWYIGSRYSFATFSILERIDSPATNSIANKASLVYLNFQYPRTDRFPCNVGSDGRIVPAKKVLSVSSNGSIPLQPIARKGGKAGHERAFSILERIDSPATEHRIRRLTTIEPFSILERIDSPAT